MFDLLAQTTVPSVPPAPIPPAPIPPMPTPGAAAPSGSESTSSPVAGTVNTSGTTAGTTTGTTAPGTPAGAKATPPDSFLLIKQMGPLVLIMIVVFIVFNRSKKKETQGRTDMLAKLKKGDEVQTIGGILGKVMDAREDKVLVKVDENSNTKIWFSRTAIHRVVGAEEETK